MGKRAIQSFLTLTAMAWLAQPVQAGTARPGLAAPEPRQQVRAEARKDHPGLMTGPEANRPAALTERDEPAPAGSSTHTVIDVIGARGHLYAPFTLDLPNFARTSRTGKEKRSPMNTLHDFIATTARHWLDEDGA